MDVDLLVRGGRVVTAEGSFQADIGIKDTKIVAIANSLSASAGAQTIDATGLVVAPGAIDVHTHFATNVGEGSTADDYESGSRAAAAGGITSFINFAFQRRGHSLHDAVEEEQAKANGKTHLDYGIHVVVTDLTQPAVLDEIGQLAGEGFTSLKLFTTIDEFRLSDADVLRVLTTAARHQAMVNVHAEDDGLISAGQISCWPRARRALPACMTRGHRKRRR